MIITTQKPINDIIKYLEPYRNILIIGCGTCATEVQTGGEKEVQEMAEKLRGKQSVKTMVIESPCDERLTRKEWAKIKESSSNVDAILSMACGAGTQTIAEIIDIPAFPALDTHFLGKVERIGLYSERCRACGSCLLGETGGICPVTRCAKSLMNGPCGGMYDGKCEAKGYVRDCAWYLIYERLKKQGRLATLRNARPPRDFGLEAYPRGIDALPSHMAARGGKGPLLGPDETEETVAKTVREAKESGNTAKT